MRLRPILAQAAFALASTAAAASWGFQDGTVTVSAKGEGVGAGTKEKLSAGKPLATAIAFGGSDTLKVILTTTDGSSPKKPHQAFLTLRESSNGLEESFPLSIKESGKGKVEITHKDLPYQILTSSAPVKASLVIASFGSSTPYKSVAFDLKITTDPNAPNPKPEAPVRYGKREEIHHIFRSDPKSPPRIITLTFTLAVLAALPALLIAWVALGANGNHLQQALSGAPVAHALFFGSVVAMEGVFFLYYTSWNLFQTLPVALGVGAVAYVSGSKALTEVQERRLQGLR